MSVIKYQNSMVADKDGWMNFDSEECERDRQQYLADANVLLTKEQQTLILKCFLALLPSRYKHAQYRITCTKGWVLNDVPEYQVDLRYEKDGEQIQDSFVFKCTRSNKKSRRE